MKGYVFHYYKYGIDLLERKGINEESKESTESTEIDYITFGEYDRVAIAQVDSFSRFRDLSDHANGWWGKRRSILLYELDNLKKDDKSLEQYPMRISGRENDTANFGFVFTEKAAERFGFDANKEKKLFLGLTIINVAEEVRCSETFDVFLKSARTKILEFLDKQNTEKCMAYEVFGTLGSSGIAIVWFTDQYSDILTLVEKISSAVAVDVEKEEKRNCFTSLYTLLAKNRFEDNNPAIAKIKKIKGNGQLYFSLHDRNTIAEFKEYLEEIFRNERQWFNEKKLEHCMGEYDYSYKVRIKDVYSIFDTVSENVSKRACLNSQNEYYKGHICRTKLVFYEEQQAKESFSIIAPIEIKTTLKNFDNLHNEQLDQNISNVYLKLRELWKGSFPHTAGMVDTLDLLYSDYKSNYRKKEHIWSPDFSVQFLSILESLCVSAEQDVKQKRKNASDEEQGNEEQGNEEQGNEEQGNEEQENELDNCNNGVYLEKNRILTNALNQQIYHMFDSGNAYLEVPPCHLRYTGQHDMLLYAYFGVIKNILTYLYQQTKESYQPELIPLVTVDVVPIIQTELFTDVLKYNEKRIVNIYMPSVALFDFPTYIAYSVHELFHYAAPANREWRNKLYLFVYFVEIMTEIIQNILGLLRFSEDKTLLCNLKNEYLKGSSIKRRRITNLIRKYCFQHMIVQIDSIYTDLYQYFKQCKEENNFILLDHLMKKVIIFFDEISIDSVDEYNDRTGICNKIKNIIVTFFDQENEAYINFLKEFWSVLYDKPRSASTKDDIAIQKIKDIFEESVIQDAAKQAFRCIALYEQPEFVYLKTIEVFREVSADIAMVDLCQMDLEEYLFHYVRVKKDLLYELHKNEFSENELIRLGILIDKLRKKHNQSMNNPLVKENFVLRYLAFYFMKKNNVEDGKKRFEQQKEDAEKWFDYIRNGYKHYVEDYQNYREKVFRDICDLYEVEVDLCEKFAKKYKYKLYKEILEKCKDAVEIYMNSEKQEGDYKKLVAAKQRYNNEIFQLNVTLILQEQNQVYLGKLNVQKQNKKCIKEKTNSFFEKYKKDICIKTQPKAQTSYKQEEKVYTFTDVMRALMYFSDQLKKRQNQYYPKETSEEIWYRGEELSEWKLLPKLLRQAQNKKTDKLLTILQRENVEKFKTICESMDSIEVSRNPDSISMITNMQHYSVGTNLLDWSEDALSSLYFCLRNIVDPNIDKLKKNELEKRQKEPSAIYVLNPVLYNKAMRIVLEYYGKEREDIEEEKEAGLRKLQNCFDTKLLDVWGGEIPNTSLPEYKGIYDAYVNGDLEKEKEWKKFYEAGLLTKEEDKSLLPLAILTSRVSPRIRAQHGRFMAYNLFIRGDYIKEENINDCGEKEMVITKCSYEHWSLNEIQQEFIRVFQKLNYPVEKCIFMHKVILANSEVKESTANWLRSLQIREDRIYPEVVNIIKRTFSD